MRPAAYVFGVVMAGDGRPHLVGSIYLGEGDAGGPPTTGGVRVTTVTAGADLDPDGYTAALDDSSGAALPIGINGSVTFTPLSPGTHSLTLRGTTANCLVAGANSQTVSVVAGQTAEVTFHVTCVGRAALAAACNYAEQTGNPPVCNDPGTNYFTTR